MPSEKTELEVTADDQGKDAGGLGRAPSMSEDPVAPMTSSADAAPPSKTETQDEFNLDGKCNHENEGSWNDNEGSCCFLSSTKTRRLP